MVHLLLMNFYLQMFFLDQLVQLIFLHQLMSDEKIQVLDEIEKYVRVMKLKSINIFYN
jgi:hypothetical protein